MKENCKYLNYKQIKCSCYHYFGEVKACKKILNNSECILKPNMKLNSLIRIKHCLQKVIWLK